MQRRPGTEPVPLAPTIHVVDDDQAFRDSTARLLRASGFQVATYASADEFLGGVHQGPGCVLLDVRMPGPNGLEVQQVLATRDEPLPVVFLTGYGSIPMSVQAMKAGAEDFLAKPVPAQQLFDAVGRALERNLAARAARDRVTTLRTRYERLTPAERRIFPLVVSGMLNKQIAYDLQCSERTVKAHRAKVMLKMEADSLADLVRMALELDLPSAPPAAAV